jgi:hypothetical protein
MIASLVRPHPVPVTYGVVITQADEKTIPSKKCIDFVVKTDEFLLSWGAVSVGGRRPAALETVWRGLKSPDIVKRAAWEEFAAEFTSHAQPLKALPQNGFYSSRPRGQRAVVHNSVVAYTGDAKPYATLSDIVEDLEVIAKEFSDFSFTATVYSDTLYLPSIPILRLEMMRGIVVPFFCDAPTPFTPLKIAPHKSGTEYSSSLMGSALERITSRARALSAHHDFAVIRHELFALSS